MKSKLLVLFTFIFTFATANPTYASNMGDKKIFTDPKSATGFTLVGVDHTTEQMLNKEALILNKMTDLIIKSSDLFNHSNKGRDLNFQKHLNKLQQQFSELAGIDGYFIGSSDNTSHNNFQSLQIINTAFNHILIADLNADFAGLLMADVNYDIANAKIIFRQNANGIAQVGLRVVGANSAG
ncbi:MAG: hypothetical protein AAB956_00790, partial [Patescibacteria group bacterium]